MVEGTRKKEKLFTSSPRENRAIKRSLMKVKYKVGGMNKF